MQENEVAIARGHVLKAEAHVARQRQLIDELRRNGHRTLEAESLLQVLEATLKTHRDGLNLRLAMSNDGEP